MFQVDLGQSQQETLLVIPNLIANQPFKVVQYCFMVDIKPYLSVSKPVSDRLGPESSPPEPEPEPITIIFPS